MPLQWHCDNSPCLYSTSFPGPSVQLPSLTPATWVWIGPDQRPASPANLLMAEEASDCWLSKQLHYSLFCKLNWFDLFSNPGRCVLARTAADRTQQISLRALQKGEWFWKPCTESFISLKFAAGFKAQAFNCELQILKLKSANFAFHELEKYVLIEGAIV